MIYIILLLIFSWHPLEADQENQGIILSFSTLSQEYQEWVDQGKFHESFMSLEGQIVQIKGFLYSKNGEWVLASEPNLKSCCIGSKNKISQQINLTGQFFSNEANPLAIVLQGVFHINPKKNLEDAWVSLYSLAQSKIIEEKKSHWAFLSFLLGCLVLFAIFLVKNSARFKSNT